MNNLDEEIFGTTPKPKSKALIGTLCAILGALIGSILWIVVYQFGYIASIVSLAIIYCAYKGYTMATKETGAKAAIIATVVSILVVIAANFVCWGITIAQEFDMGIIDSIIAVPILVFDPALIEADAGILGAFMSDMLMGILFIGVGAFSMFRKQRTPKNKSGSADNQPAVAEQSQLNAEMQDDPDTFASMK